MKKALYIVGIVIMLIVAFYCWIATTDSNLITEEVTITSETIWSETYPVCEFILN